MQVTGPTQARVRHHLRLRAKPAMLVELWSFDPREGLAYVCQRTEGIRIEV